MSQHKRWDLLHEPITADDKQSYPIISQWRHCLLTHDFFPFILNYPIKPTACSWGSSKTQMAQGRQERCEIPLKLYLLVSLLERFFRKMNHLYYHLYNVIMYYHYDIILYYHLYSLMLHFIIYNIWIVLFVYFFFSSNIFRSHCLPCLLERNPPDIN